MKNRSELREIIIKVLYQTYIYDSAKIKYDINEIIEELLDQKQDFVTETVNKVKEKQTEINKIANKYLKDWDIERLNKVDKAILSLGIYELLYTNTPHIVSINEAIELSKKYSDEKVTKMINATLDNIYHSEVTDE